MIRTLPRAFDHHFDVVLNATAARNRLDEQAFVHANNFGKHFVVRSPPTCSKKPLWPASTVRSTGLPTTAGDH